MTKRLDPDVKVLKAAARVLNQSTSYRMLRANIDFLVDRYLTHPSPEMLEFFEKKGRRQEEGFDDGR